MPNRNCILDLIKENDTVVEVGVWKGEFSKELLSRNPKTLYLVDPWKTFTEGKKRWYSIEQEKMDKIYSDVKDKFAGDDRVVLQRMGSLEFNPQQQVDLVYIDGDHSYEAVKADILHWWPKIKNGGWLSGDDWYWTDKDDPSRKGPKPAVEEFVAANNLKLNLGNNQWWIQKA